MGSQFNSYDSFAETMPPTFLLFTFSAMIISCKGECPSMSDIPVMYHDEAFTCAMWWHEKGGNYSVDSCNGDSFTNPNGGDGDAGTGCYYKFGSVFVKPGCTLYMFKNAGYSGESHVISGPKEVYSNAHWGRYPGTPGPASFRCRCIQKRVDCEPEDAYEVVLWCDGRDAVVDTTCTYEKTVGTEFSMEVSEGMSIDKTIEAEMSAQFWGIFEARMGMSTTTGYDWGHVSTQTKSEQATVTVEGTVPPGHVLIIEQAIGHCGGSEARTDMFKISHQDEDGNVVSQRVHRTLENQTFMAEIHDANDYLQGTERGGYGVRGCKAGRDRGEYSGPVCYSIAEGEHCGACSGCSALISERNFMTLFFIIIVIFIALMY